MMMMMIVIGWDAGGELVGYQAIPVPVTVKLGKAYSQMSGEFQVTVICALPDVALF